MRVGQNPAGDDGSTLGHISVIAYYFLQLSQRSRDHNDRRPPHPLLGHFAMTPPMNRGPCDVPPKARDSFGRCAQLGRPTDSHSFDGDNAGIGSDGEKGNPREGGKKDEGGGNFAFERNGGNYGGELRCNIREAGHAAAARKRYGSQEGGCA